MQQIDKLQQIDKKSLKTVQQIDKESLQGKSAGNMTGIIAVLLPFALRTAILNVVDSAL